MKLDHCLTPYTKVNSKWIKYLNVSHEPIKLLEDNIGKNFLNINMSNFSWMHLLGQDKKIKNEHMGLHHAKNFCTAQDTISRTKRHPTVWENIFVNDISNKGLTSKIYKELRCLNTHKTNNPIKKWAEE